MSRCAVAEHDRRAALPEGQLSPGPWHRSAPLSAAGWYRSGSAAPVGRPGGTGGDRGGVPTRDLGDQAAKTQPPLTAGDAGVPATSATVRTVPSARATAYRPAVLAISTSARPVPVAAGRRRSSPAASIRRSCDAERGIGPIEDDRLLTDGGELQIAARVGADRDGTRPLR